MERLDGELAAVLDQIREYESVFAQLINENNQLECEFLEGEAQWVGRDRPIALHNALVKLEREHFSDESECNPDFVDRATREYLNEVPALSEEVSGLSQTVGQKRQVLSEIIEALMESEATTPRAKVTVSSCSEEVENLARQFAQSVDEVDHEDLVTYLARGPETCDMDSLIRKAKELAEIRFNCRTARATNQLLHGLIPRVEKLLWHSTDDSDAQVDELVDKLIGSTETLAELHEEMPNNAECVEPSRDEVDALVREVEGLRQKVLAVVSRKNDVPLPLEITNPEKEKLALTDCLASLQSSIDALFGYLSKLRDEGIVDSRIYTFEEVEAVAHRYSELKKR
jgi:HAMP domain-containing protein